MCLVIEKPLLSFLYSMVEWILVWFLVLAFNLSLI